MFTEAQLAENSKGILQKEAEHAKKKTNNKHSNKPGQVRLFQTLKIRIIRLIKHEKWSPELIAEQHSLEDENCVSYETIYKWVWTAKHRNHRHHREYK